MPHEIKKDRLNRLMAVQNEISLANHQKMLGEVVEVLADGPSKNPGSWNGRTRTGILVLWPEENKTYAIGQKLCVKIDTAQTWLVKGKAID